MAEKKDDDEGAVDETGADAEEHSAKEELFEAIDHFKNAASILFGRATNDPAVKNATKEAGRIAKKVGDAAEPLAKQLADEVTRMTRDVMSAVEGKPTAGRKTAKKKAKKAAPTDEEE
jgi:hypothetical protein